MSIEKPGRYVIFGAGAIGSAIAGLLTRAGSRVVCVARPVYSEALRKGIVIKESGEELTVSVDAVSAARELSPEYGDVAFITTKSQSTEDAADQLVGGRGFGGRAHCGSELVRSWPGSTRNSVLNDLPSSVSYSSW